MLISAAATKWNVSVSDCYAESGHVIHKPSGKKLHYGELAEAASNWKYRKNQN
jgi:isoquinoline 1-oxidoreductase beta subunit